MPQVQIAGSFVGCLQVGRDALPVEGGVVGLEQGGADALALLVRADGEDGQMVMQSAGEVVAGECVRGEKTMPLAHPGDPSGSPGRRKGTRVSVENADAAPAAEGAATTRAGRTRGPAFPSLCADAFMAAPQRRPGSWYPGARMRFGDGGCRRPVRDRDTGWRRIYGVPAR